MKQGTIACIIFLEAALVLGLVYYAAGGYRAFLPVSGPGVATESANAALLPAGEDESASGNAIPQQTQGAGEGADAAEDQLPDGTEWGLQYRDEYLPADGTGELYLGMRYEYDTEGHLICVECYLPDGSESLKEEYQYDTDGNLTRYVHTPKTAGDSVRAGVYTYDEEGRLGSADTYDGEAKLISELVYVYDDEDRVYREIRYLPEEAEEKEDGTEETKLVIYTVREYTYDKDGNRTKDWTFFSDSKIAGPWEEYEYDEEGRLSAILYRESDGSLQIRESYTYTESGEVGSVISTDAAGAVRWRHYKDYDEQGHLIHSEVRDEETLVTWQLFRYDEDGRKTEMYDNAGELRYIYDENGLLSETVRYSDIGEPASEANLSGRTVYLYQPVPAGTAYLPED